MKDIEQRLHDQFPDSVGKEIQLLAIDLGVYDDLNYDEVVEELREEYGLIDAELLAYEKCCVTHKAPKGYMFVTTTDNTLYLVKAD